jgi:hypothetical protein
VSTTVAFAAILAAAMPAAYAQTRATPDVIGSAVYDVHNHKIGRVKDLP